MENFICIDDFEKSAVDLLPPAARDYYHCGAGEELTLKWNREAYKKYIIRPRVLRDVSKRDISTVVLGEMISMPLGIAPTALQRMAHPDGECATAKAAQNAGTIFIQSTMSTSSIEEVARAAPKAIKWFQLYVHVDRSVTMNLIRRAEKAQFKALVLTVDTPFFGVRRVNERRKSVLPDHLKLANFDDILASKMNNTDNEAAGLSNYVSNLLDTSLSWSDIDWLKSVTDLPIILKGIVTGEDAILAVEHGIKAIIVSNHGGRQLDTTPATIDALADVVKAVQGKVEVYLDGGVRQGTDVFKALALGARMVFLGRPMLWGLVHGGETGARAILQLMKKDFDATLALAGCRSVPEITADMVVHNSYYSRL